MNRGFDFEISWAGTPIWLRVYGAVREATAGLFPDEIAQVVEAPRENVLCWLDVLARLNLVEQIDIFAHNSPWVCSDPREFLANDVRLGLLRMLNSAGHRWVALPDLLRAIDAKPLTVGICLWLLDADGYLLSFCVGGSIGPPIPAWRSGVQAEGFAGNYVMELCRQITLISSPVSRLEVKDNPIDDPESFCEHLYDYLYDNFYDMVYDDVLGIRGDGELVRRSSEQHPVLVLPACSFHDGDGGHTPEAEVLAVLRTLHGEVFSREELYVLLDTCYWWEYRNSRSVSALIRTLEEVGTIERVAENGWRAIQEDQRVVLLDNRHERGGRCNPLDICTQLSARFNRFVPQEVVPVAEPPCLEKQLEINGPPERIARTKPGRQRSRGKNARIDWDAQPLGELPDTHLAERLGVSGQAVHAARTKRGIPMFQTDGQRPRSENAGIDWDTQPLGEGCDLDLAKQLGVTKEAVRAARRHRGISSARRRSGRPASADWDAQPLGQVSDVELAKKLGVSTSTVRLQRDKRGIPPYTERIQEKELLELLELPESQEPVELQESPERDPLIADSTHVHKCPVCRNFIGCCADCELIDGEEGPDGSPAGMYKTCRACLKRLEKEPGSRGSVYVSSGLAR